MRGVLRGPQPCGSARRVEPMAGRNVLTTPTVISVAISVRRSGNSWARGGRGSPRSRSDCPCTETADGSPGCAARRSPSSRASRASTTHAWSAATPPASPSVIDGIARVLRLDEAERTHLLDLLRGANTTRPPRRRPAQQRVRPTVQRVLDSMLGTPAFVLSGRLDILAANLLGRALFSPVYADPVRPPNNARFVFLDPGATEFFRDWDKVAGDTVAMLRAEVGRDPTTGDCRT